MGFDNLPGELKVLHKCLRQRILGDGIRYAARELAASVVTATATDLEYVWPRLSLWRLSIPQPAICVRRPPNEQQYNRHTAHVAALGGEV